MISIESIFSEPARFDDLSKFAGLEQARSASPLRRHSARLGDYRSRMPSFGPTAALSLRMPFSTRARNGSELGLPRLGVAIPKGHLAVVAGDHVFLLNHAIKHFYILFAMIGAGSN